MANTIISPNMGLILPVPGADPGPDYGSNQNQSGLIVDSHNHSPGSGVLITPAGLNINTNLTFQNNQATNIYGVSFSSPATSSQLSFLYTAPQSGGGVYDLFYNDGAGNVVALTKAGAVNATIASIPGESYSGGTFTWKQGSGSTTPANFDIGSITIRPNTAGTTNGVVLGPPSGIASQYNLNLPFVPGATGFLQIDTSGNMSASIPIVGGLTTTNLSASAGILGTQIAASTITRANEAAVGQQVTSPVGIVTTTSTSYVTTGIVVTITTHGRPVIITLQPDGSGSSASVRVLASTSANAAGAFALSRDGVTSPMLAEYFLQFNPISSGVGNYIWNVNPGISFVDVPSAASHTYTLYYERGAITTSVSVNNMVLMAYEL